MTFFLLGFSADKETGEDMAVGKNIRTYFQGTWHDGDIALLKGADHAMWLGSSVFDGARFFDGVTPDLDLHCARTNASAEALMLRPTVGTNEMVEIALEGLKGFAPGAAVYIRPMYWATDGDMTTIAPTPESTAFALCLEEIPMAPAEASATLTRTRFRRPVLENAVVNAKAGCLYPNNARMLREARSKGFSNALVLDAMGNVAETATTNVFMTRDGEVYTPIPNGTFLAGITRARHIANMRADGITVHETVLGLKDFEEADEIFLSGNMSKVTPVTAFDDHKYQIGPLSKRVRELYWDWAASQ
jgi:branched-chain amino acid aminotransferase